MKNLKIASGLLMAVAFCAASCSDDRDHNPIAQEPETFVLNEPEYGTTNILLEKTKSIDFAWSQPAYGTTLVPTYSLQASTQADFSDIPSVDDDGNDVMVSSVTTLANSLTTVSASVKGKDLNSLILKNYNIQSTEDMYKVLAEHNGFIPVYLRATSAFNEQTILSNIVSIQTVPFFVEPASFMQYYIVGAMTGWSTGSTSMWGLLQPSAEEKNVYSYTTKWEGDANLKFWEPEDWGDWGKAWSTPTDGDNSPSGNLVKDGSGAMVCPEPGAFYTYTINMGDFTYAWTKCDNQSPAEYTSISLIGIDNDWNTDYELTASAPHNWYVKNFTFGAKTEFKFRADGAWDANWGVELDLGETPYGVGKQNGSNMTAPDGTFDIYFNDITGEFTFVKK